MKYQRFYGILVICLCAVLMAGAIVYAISDHAEPQTQDAGQIRTAGTRENGPVMQENRITLNEDQYFMEWDENGHFKSMVQKEYGAACNLGTVNSKEDAISKAKALLEQIDVNFSADTYEATQCALYGEGENELAFYSMIFKEKIGEKSYGSRDVSVFLLTNGDVQMVICSGTPSTQSEIAAQTAKQTVSEDKAIEIAYQAIAKRAEELNTPAQSADPVKTSDAALPSTPQTAFQIDPAPSDLHTVSAVQQMADGKMQWQVTVGNVPTGFPEDGMTFWVSLDAETGEVLEVSNSR